MKVWIFSLVLIAFSLQSFCQSLSIRLEHKANYQYTRPTKFFFESQVTDILDLGVPSDYFSFKLNTSRPYRQTLAKFGISLDWRINERFNLEAGVYYFEDMSYSFSAAFNLGEILDESTGLIYPEYRGISWNEMLSVTKVPILISYNLHSRETKTRINTDFAFSLGANVLYNNPRDSIYSDLELTTISSNPQYNRIQSIKSVQYGNPFRLTALLGGIIRLKYKNYEFLSLKIYYELGFTPYIYTTYSVIVDNHYFSQDIYNFGNSLNFVVSIPIRILKFKGKSSV